MLNLQIVSDLHIEYKNDETPNPLDYITPEAEILILAGDIGSFYKINQLREFLSQLCVHFETVVYIPGNHEYYIPNDNYTPLSMYKLLDRVYEIEKEISNLYVLNQSSVIINDVCISGCTLWSRAEINIPKFIVKIPDMNTYLYNKKHFNDLKYIDNMNDYCIKNNLKLVVVTHHCPTDKVLTFRKRYKYASLYTTNLEQFIAKSNIHTWICGHVHQNFDFIEGNTRIVGNQRGKPRDNIEDFSKSFVIDI